MIRRHLGPLRLGGISLQHWSRPAYIGALLILLDQLLQIRATLGTIDLTVPIIRFQAAALVSGRIGAIGLALLLSVAAAAAVRNRGWVRGQGVIALFLGALLAVVLATLWVDGPRVKPTVPGNQTMIFTAQWIRGMVVAVTGGIALAVFGIRLITAR